MAEATAAVPSGAPPKRRWRLFGKEAGGEARLAPSPPAGPAPKAVDALEAVRARMIPSEFTQTEAIDLESRNPGGPTIDAQGKTIGYYPGCLKRLKEFVWETGTDWDEIYDASLKLLRAAGVDPAVVTIKCCGHDQLNMGLVDTYERLKAYNVAQINASGLKTIVCNCAECAKTLREYGTNAEVLHISEFLAGKKLEFATGSGAAFNVTFHDPCRLGRGMGVYEQPRELMREVPGATVVELAHHHEDGLCCGVNAWMNCNQNKPIRIQRMGEAEEVKARYLVCACTKCIAHFNCLKGEEGRDYRAEVVDLTVFLARHLREPSSAGGQGSGGS